MRYNSWLTGMKDIILWNHERGTWQYDVFCGLIIAFIFLTPNRWFDKRETLATQTSRLIVKPEDFSAEKTTAAGGTGMPVFLQKE